MNHLSRIVRTGLLANLSRPLMLGSVWALIPVVLVMVMGQVVRNTNREDRTLRSELPGYRQSSESVRYRVLPGVW